MDYVGIVSFFWSYSYIWTGLNFKKVNMALHILSQIYAAVPTMSEYSVISRLGLINLGILHPIPASQIYESDMY